MRCKPAEQAKNSADGAESAADKGERQKARHNRRRRKQDPKLQRAAGELIGFLGRVAVVAVLFNSLGLGRELLASLTRRGL